MLTNIYVIDYVLKDLDGAKDRLDRIFGTEPLWIHPDMTPGQKIRATYYQIPGTDDMSHALGMFQEGGDSIRVAHDRLFLIGVMCDDIEKTMAEISARGLKWAHQEPHRYAVGESNTLGTLHGVEVFVARHIPGGDKVARQMMFTKDGSSDFGDDTQGGQFLGFHGLDFAVNDLDTAIATYTKVFGSAPKDTTARTAASGVRSAHFAAPGNERGNSKGFHEIGFFTPDAPQASPLARQLTAWLERHGEGIFRMDLRVKDVDAMRALLKDRGIVLPEGDTPSLTDIHGTDLRYVAI
jgi:hypothetical protein